MNDQKQLSYQQGVKDGNDKANEAAEKRINEAYEQGVEDTLKKLKLSETQVKVTVDCDHMWGYKISSSAVECKQCGKVMFTPEVIKELKELGNQ